MKSVILLIIINFSFSALCAQEYDSVDYSESYDSDEEDNQEEEEQEKETTHTLIAPEDLAKTQEYKAEKITVRKFDHTKWEKIIGTTNYEEKNKEKKKEKNKADQSPPIKMPWNSDVLRVIAYIIIIALIITLLYFVLKNISITQKIKQVSLPDDGSGPVDNIEELDINALLQQALIEKKLRLAVRLYYLDLLKNLDKNGIIIWKKNKTNRDYLFEVFEKNYFYDEIKKLTQTYEQIWYGEHTLTTESFERFVETFTSITQKLNLPKAS
jgi:hypothetical protein